MKKILVIMVFVFTSVCFGQEVVVEKLPSGQTVVVEEIKANPMVIIDTWIKTGSVNETDKNNGVAHFLEHLFFKGSKNYPAGSFDKILESKGAVTNAATSRDFTHYYILIPSKDFELALKMHADMLLNPLLPPDEIEKERGVVIEEISKGEDSPSRKIYSEMFRSFYKTHPYKRDVIGTREIISKISRDEILDFYHTWYTPNNMTTVIVGDIDSEKAVKLVKDNFIQPKTANKTTKPKYKVDLKPQKPIKNVSSMDIDTNYFSLAFKGTPDLSSKDNYALDVLSVILGDGRTSRLYKSLKDEKELVFSVSAGNSNMVEDSLFIVSATYSSSDTEEIKNEIFKEINSLKTDLVSEGELKKAKSMIERDTFYSRESVSNIANELGYVYTLNKDLNFYNSYVSNINKVTAEDIKRVANKYLTEQNSVLTIVQSKNQPSKTLSKAENKDYSYKILKQDGDTTKYLLSNGAELVITQNKTNDIIAVNIASPKGLMTEEIKGTASICAKTMTKGTKKYDKQTFSELLEQNGIKLALGAGTEIYTASMKFTKNDSALAFDILKEVVNNALLSDNEIEKAKSDKMFEITQSKNQPSGIAFDEYKHLVWGGSTYDSSNSVLQNSVPKIKREDVVKYYNGLFDAQNLKISVNGNVNPDEFIKYFTDIFNKTDAPKLDITTRKTNFPAPSVRTKLTEKDSQALWLVMGWHTEGINNQKDWAVLNVLNAILGSGMSSRLFVNLRDSKSLAYQVGSDFSANIQKGVFTVYIGTNPKRAREAKEGLINEINLIKKEFVSDDELRDAKSKLIGNYIISMETNGEKAATVNWLEITGRGYEFITKYPELINAVTKEDIKEAANKYFSKPYFLSVAGDKKSIKGLDK
ncbi:insulinase family protein [bacterium]|nr:insulinase family protein [bacterium]